MDYEQRKLHDADPDANPGDGVLKEVVYDDESSRQPLGETVSIVVPQTFTYTPEDGSEPVGYNRISDRELTLKILPETTVDPETGKTVIKTNVIDVFYRKDAQKVLKFKIVCLNDTDDTIARLSHSQEIVENQQDITPVDFILESGQLISGSTLSIKDTTQTHQYTFLGWYSDPKGEGDRLAQQDTDAPDLNASFVPALPGADMTYYAVFRQDQVSLHVDVMYSDDGKLENYEDGSIDTDGSVTGYSVVFNSPQNYQDGMDVPMSFTEDFVFEVAPVDDRVCKYEFAGWYERFEDGSVVPNHHDTYNSPMHMKIEMVHSWHYIAMFKKVTAADYKITYRYKPRQVMAGQTKPDGYNEYVVKGTLRDDELYSATEDASPALVLTNEFIHSNAPFESNHNETLYWTDSNIVKTSKDGVMVATVTAKQETQKVIAYYRLSPDDPFTAIKTDVGANRGIDSQLQKLDARNLMHKGYYFSYWAIRKSPKDDAPIIAKCYDAWFSFVIFDNYYITPVFESNTPSGNYVRLDLNGVADSNGDWAAWTWSDNTAGHYEYPYRDDSDESTVLVFSGLEKYVRFVRLENTKKSLDTDNVQQSTEDLTVTNGRTFTLFNTCAISDSVLHGSWDENAIMLTSLDNSRNQWTDDNGDMLAGGKSDYLYADFEIAFTDGTEKIANNPNYTAGTVIETCGKFSGTGFDPDACSYETDTENLKSTVREMLAKNPSKGGSGLVEYAEGKKRTARVGVIPITNLTNRSRIECCKPYYNAYKLDESNNKDYTNGAYIYKITAYLMDKEGTVTLSNSVYVCLIDIASQDSATKEMWRTE